jgi:hypothetical protein
VPVFSLPPRSNDAPKSSFCLHTEIFFQAFPFGRLGLSTRPSVSKMPVSSIDGVVTVIASSLSSSGKSIFSGSGDRTTGWGKCVAVPGETSTLSEWANESRDVI